MKAQLVTLKVWLLFVGLSSLAISSNAQELELASGPLFLGTSVDANVFFELDDSGSMDWETLTESYFRYDNYWKNSSNGWRTDGIWWTKAETGAHQASSQHRRYPYMFNENDRNYSSGDYGRNAEQNPESLDRDWRARSSDFNLLYYNPNTNYQPWAGMPDAIFTAARSDPQPGSDGYNNIRNLSGFLYDVWIDDHGYGGSRPNSPRDATDGPNGLVDLWDGRLRFGINSTTWHTNSFLTDSAAEMDSNPDCTLTEAQQWNVAGGWRAPYYICFGAENVYTPYSATDLNPWGRLLSQEQQNVANWYQYYRKRSYVAKAAISEVITQSTDFRYGLSVINNYNNLFVEVPASGVTDYTASNAALLQSLFSFDWPAKGTPLRRGLERTGRYFDDELSGKVNPIISECQQNFSILLTDGYWNGSSPASSIGDADGDNSSISVADVAKYYYDRDLSPLPNKVATSLIDGNNQQHMVTFTVAFGVTGALVDTDNDGYPNPTLEEDDDWGGTSAKIDDLWHAAFNSKGEYIAAQSPGEVVASLNSALSEITDRVGSSASVATNSGSLRAGSHLFQARFDSGGWSGELIAFSLNSDGSINPSPSWEAGEVLDTKDFNLGREIITFNPEVDIDTDGNPDGAGIAFDFPTSYLSANTLTEFSSRQVDALLANGPFPDTVVTAEITSNQSYGNALVDFLRGDHSNEGTSGYSFRLRDSAMGDIVDSDPQYVGPPRGRYPEFIEGALMPSYTDFIHLYAARTPMVYVGANDGMLHAFEEANGNEKFAFVPNATFSNLPNLADSAYVHQYFVDEAPVVVDAFLDDTMDPISGTLGVWASVLVGGLGGGGQAVYALNVTDPSTFDESNAADMVLWEFDDSEFDSNGNIDNKGDSDLGYSYSVPSIAKMANGQWAAVFGNGYNSTETDDSEGSGHAVLYIVDIDTGVLIKKIDTGVGGYADQNGLSSPALIDVDGDFIVDIIYAGDLQGNMWKFDVDSNDTDDWAVGFMDGTDEKPLIATGQPITTRPQVTLHPENRDGYMVFFGTGQYVEKDDNNAVGADTQAFYGIWDKDDGALPNITLSSLQQQSIINQYSLGIDTDGDDVDDTQRNVRSISSNDVNYDSERGWYMQLIPEKIDGVVNTNNFGEKQVSDAVVRDGRVIFTTLIPSQDPCDFGGTSFIMQLDYADGGKLTAPPFDVNGDGVVDEDDAEVDGVNSEVGITPTVSIVVDIETGIEYLYSSGSTGDIGIQTGNGTDLSLGRQSWRQLK